MRKLVLLLILFSNLILAQDLIIFDRQRNPVPVNSIGIQGREGFGVGIAPVVPSYIEPLPGYNNPYSDNYGNYLVKTDSSIMCWIPAFYYKIINNTSSPYFGTQVLIKGFNEFSDTTSAAAQGYVIHRAFIDGGQIKQGFFFDKYGWSLTNFVNNSAGIASSIKNGSPISSSSATKRNASNNYAGSFSNCVSNGQTPADILGEGWSVAKSRGNDFAVASIFMSGALALLQLAHAQAVSSAAYCAWYDPLKVKNFPKGNNNYGADSDHFNQTFIQNNMDLISIPFVDGSIAQRFGNGTNQVLSGDIDRNSTGYKLTAAGLPMNASGISISGGNNFGRDYFYQYYINEVCARMFGSWGSTTYAGIRSLALNYASGSSLIANSGRSCLYVP
jgi:hypothetical protein